jgi:hypothetical protein
MAKHGLADNGVITVDSPDNVNGKGNRISNCHFKEGPNMDADLTVYNGYGVMDHCFLERGGGLYVFIFREVKYGGHDFGNGAWSDSSWFGTDKFFFIEDCTVKRSNNYSISDSFEGGRWVIRHNYFDRGSLQDHGTEGGQARGHRAREVYNNTFNHTKPQPTLGFRSGTGLVHDNIRTGTAPRNNNFGSISNYRAYPARAFPIFGTADGTSIWDMNVTDVDTGGKYPTLDKSKQHFVEGHSGFLFQSGSATEPGTVSGSTGTFKDNTKHWTPNIWVNYSVRNMTCSTCGYKDTPPSKTDSMASYIISNTENTITYAYYSATDTGGHLLFATGDQYEIHRVLEMMDECGHGKTDLIGSAGENKPINTTVTPQRPYYAHSRIEAIFGWNNVFQPTGAAMTIGTNSASPVSKEGVDVFGNLGKGLTGTPSQVSTHYDAARNGVAYTGPFQYPHPLVSGSPTPTPGPTGTPTPVGFRKHAASDKRHRTQHHYKQN